MSKTAKVLLLASLSALIGLFAALLMLEAILWALPVNTGLRVQPVNEAQPVLRFQPDREYVFSRGWDFSVVNRGRVNNFGFVNDQDYRIERTSPLLAVIGDSFIEAAMVPYAETLQGRLAAKAGSLGRVYSFAASGSSLSQYLAYAKYVRDTFHADGLVISVVGNDFDESLLKYKAEPSYHYFKESPTGGLALTRVDYHPSVLRQLMRYSSLARYVATNMYLLGPVARTIGEGRQASRAQFVGNVVSRSDPVRVGDSERAVVAFLDQLPGYAGLAPARIHLVLDGIRPNLYSEADLHAASGTYFDHMRKYFIAQATRRGFVLTDLQPLFIERHRRDGSVFEFPTDGHWNGLGHEVVAEAVAADRVYCQLFGKAPCQDKALR